MDDNENHAQYGAVNIKQTIHSTHTHTLAALFNLSFGLRPIHFHCFVPFSALSCRESSLLRFSYSPIPLHIFDPPLFCVRMFPIAVGGISLPFLPFVVRNFRPRSLGNWLTYIFTHSFSCTTYKMSVGSYNIDLHYNRYYNTH